jgi:hypothetical protein
MAGHAVDVSWLKSKNRRAADKTPLPAPERPGGVAQIWADRARESVVAGSRAARQH